MAKAKKKAVKGAVKKKWVKIVAPKIFNSEFLGETYVYDTREAIGKPMKLNLMTLTKNPKKQGINVGFVVNGQHEDRLTTEITSFRMMPSVVRRMVRRGKEKIEDSFICTTMDKRKIRIKPFVVTRNKAKGSVTTSLRKMMKQFVVNSAAKSNYDSFVKAIVDSKLQREMNETLSKTFPLSRCEIRWLILLSKEAPAPKQEEKAPAEPKQEEKKEEAESTA
jgi:ribosomal protein S3AE